MKAMTIPRPRPATGIVTALPIECFAVLSVLDEVAEVRAPDAVDQMTYYSASAPSRRPGTPHRLIISVLPEDGGIAAAHSAVNLQRSWPQVQQLVMCGIACGVPRPDEPSSHVRLGDILVASDGVVPYGHVYALPNGEEELRRWAPKPSVVLKTAAGRLRIGEEGGMRPWEAVLAAALRAQMRDYLRPPADTDRLFADDDTKIAHPPMAESGHRLGQPRVHYGRIGSGGKLIKSETERMRLARKHWLIGFDMEGDGIADAAYLNGIDWWMVRGVSDYGSRKNDRWQRYAALTAAAYVHALLGELDPPETAGTAVTAGTADLVTITNALLTTDGSTGGADGGRSAIVDALLAVRTMQDRPGRDRVIAALPDELRARIPRARNPYHDAEGWVRTLEGIPRGLSALYEALRSVERDSAPLERLGELLGPRP